MSNYLKRQAHEARTRRLDFSAEDRLQAIKVDQRLHAEAAWENASRFRAQSSVAEHSSPRAADDAADETLELRRQALADKLTIEDAQLRELFAPPATSQLAARRKDMLELARQRAAAWDQLRLQTAETKERERYARDSEVLRQLEAAQLQHAVASAQDQQRAIARAWKMQDAADAQQWSRVEEEKLRQQHMRQLQDCAHRDALAAEHARNLELEMERHEAAQQDQRAQKSKEMTQQRQQWKAEQMTQQQEARSSQAAKARYTAEALASERQQLEQQLSRQQAAEQHVHDGQLQEARRQAAVQDAQQAAAEAARRGLAEEVQAFQHMQIREHSRARVQQAHQAAQETLEMAQRDTAAERAVAERDARMREQDQQHWAAVQAQIDLKRAKAEQERQREREQDLAARQRAAEYETSMAAHLLQAAPVINRNYGYKKSQLL